MYFKAFHTSFAILLFVLLILIARVFNLSPTNNKATPYSEYENARTHARAYVDDVLTSACLFMCLYECVRVFMKKNYKRQQHPRRFSSMQD